ncbi:hypothetical protein LYSIN_03756 [Lysinibacillus sphaericus]|uniref:Uncharacterized protein n=1 Tax=Lysinibacillus sphaericus TaxID=1421 RepID=A0A2S5CVS7_LYSSH|nr:hypothetical protein LYSIN_03756 [Lysinibacillus sphaericus]
MVVCSHKKDARFSIANTIASYSMFLFIECHLLSHNIKRFASPPRSFQNGKIHDAAHHENV